MAKDELFDDELCSMIHFTDDTNGCAAQSQIPVQESAGYPRFCKQASTPRFLKKRLKTVNRHATWAAVFVGLSLLFLYWQRSGQMQPSAAMPSVYVCAAMVGFHLGRYVKYGK